MKEKTRYYVLAIIGFLAGIAVAFLFSNIYPENNKNNNGIKRVISLAPNITQTLIYLNSQNKIAARSDFCKIFNTVKSLPSAGNNANVNYELILKLKPDLIFYQGKNSALENFSKQHGIKSVKLNMDSISTIKEGIIKTGKALNILKLAQKKVKKIEQEIKRIEKKAKSLSVKSVLLVLNRREYALSGIFTTGKNSFLSEALRIAGGKNLFDDMKINYSSVSLETIIKYNPDIILEMSIKDNLTKDKIKKMRAQWGNHPHINAVKNRRIYFLSQKYVLIPGPGIIKTIRLFHKIITGNYTKHD